MITLGLLLSLIKALPTYFIAHDKWKTLYTNRLLLRIFSGSKNVYEALKQLEKNEYKPQRTSMR